MVSPAFDPVFEVAQAVDPAQYRASAQKMQAVASARKTAVAGNGFAGLAAANTAPAAASAVHERKSMEAFRNFEAFLLQSVVQNLFTADRPSVFGKGLSGQYWKSLLAEMLGREIAQHGGIGIASMLGKQHGLPEKTPAKSPGLQDTANTVLRAGLPETVRRYSFRS